MTKDDSKKVLPWEVMQLSHLPESEWVGLFVGRFPVIVRQWRAYSSTAGGGAEHPITRVAHGEAI